MASMNYFLNNSTVFEECGFDSCKCSFTGDAKLSQSNGYLRPSNPQLTPTTLQIQYCYSYSYEILPTCTH